MTSVVSLFPPILLPLFLFQKKILVEIVITDVLIKPFMETSIAKPIFTCSKLSIEALEQGLKYIPS